MPLVVSRLSPSLHPTRHAVYGVAPWCPKDTTHATHALAWLSDRGGRVISLILKVGDPIPQQLKMRQTMLTSQTIYPRDTEVLRFNPGVLCTELRLMAYSRPALECQWEITAAAEEDDGTFRPFNVYFIPAFYTWTVSLLSSLALLAHKALELRVINIAPTPQVFYGVMHYTPLSLNAGVQYYAPCEHEECKTVQGMAIDCEKARRSRL